MITRKNISNSYLSKKKRNRNQFDKVKQSGGAVIDYLIAKRLNFFNEFGKADSDAEAKIVNATILEAKPDILISGSGMILEPILDIKENNTILTFINLHGGLTGEIKKVPRNTIICFLSPIDESFLTHNADTGSKSFINKLTSGQFKEIVTKREFINNAIESNLRNHQGYTFYNCFKNSTWYYPDDVFPDIILQAQKSDYEGEINIYLNNLLPYRGEVVDIEYDSTTLTKTHNCSFFEKTLGLTNKDYFKKAGSENYLDNTDIQPTLDALVTDKYRIIITSACRGFSRDIYDRNILFNLRIELYYQTLNKQKVDTNPLIDLPPFNLDDCIVPQCSSRKDYYYLPEDDYKDLPHFDKFKRSYGGKVNSLMQLQEKFNKNGNTFEEIDKAYLCSFTITQIIMFLSLKEISPTPEKYKQHWFNLLLLSTSGLNEYPELTNKIKSMCDFFNSNAGIANILYIHTGYQVIDEVRANLDSLIPILTEYETWYDPELGLLREVSMAQKLIPDNYLTIDSIFKITDLRKLKFIKTLNIVEEHHSIIKFIDLHVDYYNYVVKTINIYTNKFIMNNSEDIFIRFTELKQINIDIKDNLENCYIHNNNYCFANITIKGLGGTYINNFEFKTPNVESIMFDSINFKNKYHFDRFLSNLITENRYLRKLIFKYCGFADGTMIDIRPKSSSRGSSGSSYTNPMFDPGKLELTSSHFKEMGRLETLEFIECSFSVSDTEKPQILKTLLEEMKRDKPAEYIDSIKLDLDSSEGPLFIGEGIVPATISIDKELNNIYNNLKTKKYYNSTESDLFDYDLSDYGAPF